MRFRRGRVALCGDCKRPHGYLAAAASLVLWGCNATRFQWGFAYKVPNPTGHMTWHGVQGVGPRSCRVGVRRELGIQCMRFSSLAGGRALHLGPPRCP
jgi:hypothetical protein